MELDPANDQGSWPIFSKFSHWLRNEWWLHFISSSFRRISPKMILKFIENGLGVWHGILHVLQWVSQDSNNLGYFGEATHIGFLIRNKDGHQHTNLPTCLNIILINMSASIYFFLKICITLLRQVIMLGGHENMSSKVLELYLNSTYVCQ